MAADTLRFNEAFQSTVLSYLWRTKGGIAAYSLSLLPSNFDSSVNATLWGLMVDFYKTYKLAPARTILLDLVGQAYDKETDDDQRKRRACEERITELEECDISGEKYIDKRIREFLRWSALKDFVLEAVTDLKENKFDADLPKKARMALSKGEDIFDPGLEWRDGVYVRLAEEVRTESVSRVPTGITHFDQEIGGGLRGGELGILLAVPKGFKSGTMLNFAYGAMRADLYRADNKTNTNVLYITLELSQGLVAGRFDRRCSLLSRDELIRDPDAYAGRLDYMMRTVCSNSRLFIKAWKTKSATPDTFRAYLDRMWDEYGIKFGVIFIDYLDLVKGAGSGKRHDAASLADSAALITEDIRDIAIEYNLPIWSACIQYDQAVVTNEGPMKIGTIGRRLKRDSSPLFALSHNFSSGENEWKQITNWFDNGLSSESFVRIKTDADVPARCPQQSRGSVTTKDHHYFEQGGSKIEAQDVRVGGEIMSQGYHLSADQYQVLLGGILGDGCIREYRRSFVVTHGMVQEYYIRWKKDVFSGLDAKIEEYTAKAGKVGKYLLKKRRCIRLEVSGTPEIGRLYKTFYVDGVKRVPRALLDSMTLLGLAVWFMDDGHIHKRDRALVNLYTNGFSVDDCEFLVGWFESRWGLVATRNNRNVLVFSADSSRKLLVMLSPYLVKNKEKNQSKTWLCPVTSPGRMTSIPAIVQSVSLVSFAGKRAEKRKRFDIEVADNHNYYLASGVLVSNCRATRDAVGREHLSMQHMSKSFERVGVADCVAALVQSEEDKAHGELRIALMAMRNDAGDKQIHCRVDYPLMKLTSTGVSDIVYEEDVKKAKKKASSDTSFLARVKAARDVKVQEAG